MKNKIKIIIGIVSTIILLLGGTYAAYTFFTEKTSVTMLVGGDQISFNAGANITVDKMFPVYSMEQGIAQDIEIYKQEGEYTAGIDLYLNLKSWPSVMSSPSFRWALYKNGAYLSSGDFSGQKQGDDIKLTSNSQKINLEEKKDSYTLYLWIDAYQDSNINMMNQSFTVNLYGQTTFYDDFDPIAGDKIPNHPELADGMIPIKYDYQINEWVKADTTNTNNDWYDYYNKIWANAVMVKSEKREDYVNADVGTTVNEDDILAYYVWIPRYRYVLFNTEFEKISPREIQIEFQSITDEISNGKKNDEYLTHPAFWWDNNSNGERETGEELSGIWVGKFETSGTKNSPTIKPNMPAMCGLNVYNLFHLNKKFEGTEYLTEIGVDRVDSHMIKNIEWGAVAYLSHSKYGNQDIFANNSFIAGRRGNYTYNDFIISDGNITSNKEPGTGVLASTTGNVYGIYDMSGGVEEYVMAVMLKEDGTLSYLSSGFNNNNIVQSKYYDLYEYGENNNDYTRSKLGDATGEVIKWKTSSSGFLYPPYSWFLRGGRASSSVGLFCFTGYSGGETRQGYGEVLGSRAVLILD